MVSVVWPLQSLDPPLGVVSPSVLACLPVAPLGPRLQLHNWGLACEETLLARPNVSIAVGQQWMVSISGFFGQATVFDV